VSLSSHIISLSAPGSASEVSAKKSRISVLLGTAFPLSVSIAPSTVPVAEKSPVTATALENANVPVGVLRVTSPALLMTIVRESPVSVLIR